MSAGELLINGGFHPDLWTRLGDDPAQALSCSTHTHTFAADRWYVIYSAARGSEVTQQRFAEVPPDVPASCSLELRGAEGVSETVMLAQNIEAAEAHRYRRPLRLRVWMNASHPGSPGAPFYVRASCPRHADVFATGSMDTLWRSGPLSMATAGWQETQVTFDASAAPACGLQLALEFPRGTLDHADAYVRLAGVSLHPAQDPAPLPCPFVLERQVARRYYHRISARLLNSLGRALVCNPHELHFQLNFPEMRAAPSITLPQDNALLAVYAADGTPQDGFVYDIPHVARSSAIIRATKRHHQLRDGYLSFRGYEGAIELEAEL